MGSARERVWRGATTVLAAAVLGTAGGCGGGGAGAASGSGAVEDAGASGGPATAAEITMSCDDVAARSTCSAHGVEGMALLGADLAEHLCDLAGGRWSSDPCPDKNVLGSCDDKEGTVIYYYSTGGRPYDDKRARQACKDILGIYGDG